MILCYWIGNEIEVKNIRTVLFEKIINLLINIEDCIVVLHLPHSPLNL